MSKYVQNPSPVTRLLMQGGRIELAPGEIRMLSDDDLAHPTVVYAVNAGQVKVLEALTDAAPVTPVTQPEPSAFGLEPGMSPEEYARFLASKQDPSDAPTVSPEQAADTQPVQSEAAVVPAGSDQGDVTPPAPDTLVIKEDGLEVTTQVAAKKARRTKAAPAADSETQQAGDPA